MKKILICLVMFGLCIAGLTYATVDLTEVNFPNVNAGNFDQYLRRWFDTFNTDIANAGFNLGTGVVFYVDSGAANTATVDGLTPRFAFATLDDAFDSGNATASRGDIVYCLQGHNEALTAADAVDIDVIGVTVIGLGNGALKPTFDYDGADGEFVIGATDVVIKNLRFRVSSNAVTKAIDIEAAAHRAAIVNCEFGYAETSTDEFASAIIIVAGAKDTLIEGCWFDSGVANAAQQAISMGAVSGAVIRNNTAFGDYAIACIKNGAIATELFITDNILINGLLNGDGVLNAQPAIEMADGSSGFVADNRIVSDVTTALLMRVFDDGIFMNNFVSDTDGDEFSGTIEASESGNTETSSTISGHNDG